MKVLILNYIVSKYSIVSGAIFLSNFLLIAVSAILLMIKVTENNKFKELNKRGVALIFKAAIITSILNFIMPETEWLVKVINEVIK